MWQIIGGLFLGWNLGANDSANVFGPAVAARVIRYSYAVILIAIFALIGSVIEGPKCMMLMKDVSSENAVPLMAFITTLCAGLTMLILTLISVPASTSQAIMGGIIGSRLATDGTLPEMSVLLKIVICWTVTPVGAALVAYLLYMFAEWIQGRLFRKGTVFQRVIMIGAVVSGIYGSYCLGANNVANTTGVYFASGQLSAFWASVIGGVAIAVGALTFSRGVMQTVGERITRLGPLAAFISILAQALTVHIYTQIRVPVSTSQAVVGAVVGIGLRRGIRAVSRAMLITIVIGWFATPVCAGIFSYILTKLLG